MLLSLQRIVLTFEIKYQDIKELNRPATGHKPRFN